MDNNTKNHLDLEALKAALEKATPGPWFTGPTPGYLAGMQQADGKARRVNPLTLRSPAHTEEIATVWTYLLPTEANADLIVLAVNSLPALIEAATHPRYWVPDHRIAEIEPLARELHAIYQREAKRQAETGEDDVRHPDDYDALPEHTKEYDRVLARFILQREHYIRNEGG